MQFHDFLDSKHVRTNMALQQVYHPYGQAKIQAVAGLIGLQRKILTWVNYPILLGEYVLISLRLKKAPPTALEIIQRYKDATEAALKLKAEEEKQKQLEAAKSNVLAVVDAKTAARNEAIQQELAKKQTT